MLKTSPAISVHFWNLSEYVSGRLVGGWVDLDSCEDLDDFRSKVAEITRNAEEWILSDYESDCGIAFGELTSLDTVWEVHEYISDLDENDREAFSDYLAYHGGVENLDYAMAHWRDAYCGRFNSIEDYAWSFAEDAYPDLVNVPPGFRVEVDTIAWECDHWISDNGHVFSSH